MPSQLKEYAKQNNNKIRCFIARQLLSQIYALFWCTISKGLNMRWCTKKDKYEVCLFNIWISSENKKFFINVLLALLRNIRNRYHHFYIVAFHSAFSPTVYKGGNSIFFHKLLPTGFLLQQNVYKILNPPPPYSRNTQRKVCKRPVLQVLLGEPSKKKWENLGFCPNQGGGGLTECQLFGKISQN